MSIDATAAARSPAVDAIDLEIAIEREELALAYQPIVALDAALVTGFEALVRWAHPEFGPLCASQFVPVAERAGLLRPLDDWVMRTACRQLKAWQDDVLVGPGFKMAVNISGSELDGDRLVERVRAAIAETGVDRRGLIIEITETASIDNVDDAIDSAEGLRALGVELALDDFGSRSTTFDWLRCLRFDVLKIDHDFVRDSTTDLGRAFLQATIELGDNLGMRVVAEGIETPHQLALLRALGADEGQGFLWSGAVDTGRAERLLSSGIWPAPDAARCPKLAFSR